MIALNLAWKRSVLAVAVLLSIFASTLFLFPSAVPADLQDRIPFSHGRPPSSNVIEEPTPEAPPHSEPLDLSSFPSIVQAIWSPLIVDQKAEYFTDRTGKVHSLSQKPLYTSKLGKKLVILDVDTRPLKQEGEVDSPEVPSWDNLEHLSAGILSHYLYAMLHGYDYKFVRAPEYDEKAGSWTKVIKTQELLDNHDWIVTVNSEAEFTNPELPLEWLMNYWGFDSNTAVAMAEAPADGEDMDTKDKVMLNTGLIFSQSAAPKTHEIYKAWLNCPTGEEFPGCEKWKTEKFREQTAFSEHIRYAFASKGTIVALPCIEANGSPEKPDSECTGQFLKHFWVDKKLAKSQLADGVMHAFVPQLYTMFEDHVVDWHTKTIKAHEVIF